MAAGVKSLVVLALLPLIPAASTYWAITLHGTDTTYALLLWVRTYAFTALGLVFLIGVDLEILLLWLEQHKLSPNFVYGLLVVIHALPQIMHEVAAIRKASLLRGQKLHAWSPMIYVKVILLLCRAQASTSKPCMPMVIRRSNANGSPNHP